MSSLLITSENQIHRLNLIMNEIRSLQSLDLKSLTTTGSTKSWSIIEVIEHLNIAYSFYRDKINRALANSANLDGENQAFKARAWQRFVINGQKPKNGKRKWKMKTLKRFEPLLANGELTKEEVNEVFTNFEKAYGHLKESILNSRAKDVSKVKFSSAIGRIVKFHLPEAFEFLLSHAERHMVQIRKIQTENSVDII